MREITKKMIYFAIGLIVGYSIFNISTVSINDLKTTSSGIVAGDDEDVAFANSLGLASFNGAWVSVSGGKIANKINSVVIDCWSKSKVCHIAQADIIFDNIFSNDISYFDISDWSESGQITAISESVCEDQVLKADIKTKVVTLTETRKDVINSAMCTQNKEPMVLKLGTRGY